MSTISNIGISSDENVRNRIAVTSSDDKLSVLDIEELNEMLLRWLSVAESQVCALEVLSEQIPQLNVLLEDSMIDLGNSFSSLATHSQDQTKNVTSVVESATTFDVAGNQTSIREILDTFCEIIEDVSGGKLDDKNEKCLNDIKASVDKQEEEFKKALEVATCSANDMLSAVSSAIVGMQFQDRVSQNLVIIENICREIISYLKKTTGVTKSGLEGAGGITIEDNKVVIDEEFTKKLISYLTLGELQVSFLNHLTKHGYIDDAEQLGLGGLGKISNDDDDDDIELF